MMEWVSSAAGCIAIIFIIAAVVIWVKAVANYDPNVGCKPGPDCEMCPFPPCDKKENLKGD